MPCFGLNIADDEVFHTFSFQIPSSLSVCVYVKVGYTCPKWVIFFHIYVCVCINPFYKHHFIWIKSSFLFII